MVGGRRKGTNPAILLRDHVSSEGFSTVRPIIAQDLQALPPIIIVTGSSTDLPHHLNWVGARDEEDLVWRCACCGIGEGEVREEGEEEGREGGTHYNLADKAREQKNRWNLFWRERMD
jgi:hypothetical protein